MAIRDELREKVSAVDSFDDRLAELTAELTELRNEAQKRAETLSDKRQGVFADITGYIEGLLHEMGMQKRRNQTC